MNLLPPTKDFQQPIAPKSKKINTKSFFNKKDKTVTVLLEIEKKTIKIDKLLKRSLASKLKSNEKSRIKKEEASFDKKESELEKKKPKKMKGINLPSIPSFGIFGWIKNFVFNVILGFLAVRLIKYLPMLIRLLPIISKTMDFIIDFGGKLLDGLVTFVDWGYKAYDATRGFVKNTFGEDGAKKFEDLSSKFATFMNIAIIAGMLAAGSGGGGGFGGGKTKGGATKPRPGQGFRPKVTTTGGGGAGRPNIRNPLRGRPNVTESGGLRNPLRRKPTVTGGGGRSGIRNPFRARPNITGAIGEGAEGLAAKGASKFGAKFGGKGIPVVGPLIDFAIRTLIFHEPLGRAAAGSVGLAVGQILGGIAGSVIPVGGTIIGGIIGGLIGDMIGTSLYDFISEIGGATKLAGGGSPVEAARKGNVSGPSGRTFKKKKSKRSITPTPRKISPGGSTGGKDKIMGLFPDTQEAVTSPGIIGSTTSFIGNIINNLFGGTPDANTDKDKNKKSVATKKPNPYQYLTKSAEIIGKTDFFGPLMNLGMKSNLGDKPNKTDYFLAAQGLNAWMNRTISFQGAAFAGGGEVSAQMFGQGEDYTKVIAKSIEESVSPSVDKTQKELMRNLMIKKIEPETPAPSPDAGAGADGSSGGGEGGGGFSDGGISGSGVTKGISIAKKLMVDLKISAAAASGIVGNLLHESGGLKPDNVENGKGFEDGAINNIPVGTKRVGYGWAQWTNDRLENFRKFLKSRKADNRPATDNDNYAYLIKELTTTEPIRGHWKGWNGKNIPEDDPKRAATWFMMNWERPSAPHEDSRQQYAADIYSKIKGLTREQAKIDVEKSGGIISNPDQIIAGKGGKVFPLLKGMIGTGSGQIYGAPRSYGGHAGVDVVEKAPWGRDPRLPVLAYSSGKVLSEKFNPDDPYLSGMMIDHGNFRARYLHMTPSVRPGQMVSPGQKIGKLLNLGGQTHLHFEAYQGSKRLNPTSILKAAYEQGGETLDGPHTAVIGEKGKEYVIDADSYKAVEEVTPGLLDVLNYGINDKNSFKDKLPKIIETLQQYASYEDNYESEVIIIQNDQERQNSYRPSSSGSPSISYSSGIDSKSDQFQVLNMV